MHLRMSMLHYCINKIVKLLKLLDFEIPSTELTSDAINHTFCLHFINIYCAYMSKTHVSESSRMVVIQLVFSKRAVKEYEKKIDIQ